MSTKVHDDEEDEDESLDEVDVILENAKAGLQLKRSLERKSRRIINLSDIPENFAHVPAASMLKREYSRPRTPPRTPEPAQRAPPTTRAAHCKQSRSFVRATWRWVRASFMECRAHCDMCERSVVASVSVPSRKARLRA